MKQRAVLIALVLVCLVTVVGLVEVRGWEESREGESRRHRATSPGPPSASGADPETGAVAEQILQEAEDSSICKPTSGQQLLPFQSLD